MTDFARDHAPGSSGDGQNARSFAQPGHPSITPHAYIAPDSPHLRSLGATPPILVRSGAVRPGGDLRLPYLSPIPGQGFNPVPLGGTGTASPGPVTAQTANKRKLDAITRDDQD